MRGMHRLLAAAIVALTVSSCSSSPSEPCPYALFAGSWVGSASYTATIPAEPMGASGASVLEANAGGLECSESAFVTLGGCQIDGRITGPRAMVFDVSSSPCVVQLAKEGLELRVFEGSALIAANDTLQVTFFGDLLSHGGRPLQGATTTFAFDGRRQ
jgi:hypothetical protein